MFNFLIKKKIELDTLNIGYLTDSLIWQGCFWGKVTSFHLLLLLLLLLFFSPGTRTWCLTLARPVLYHLSHVHISFFALVSFWTGCWVFSQGWSQAVIYLPCLSHSWNFRHAYLVLDHTRNFYWKITELLRSPKSFSFCNFTWIDPRCGLQFISSSNHTISADSTN
jgi:hypothetical protein